MVKPGAAFELYPVSFKFRPDHWCHLIPVKVRTFPGSEGQLRSPAPRGAQHGPAQALASPPWLLSPAPLLCYEAENVRHVNEPVFELFASVTQGFCLDAEVALATGQILAPNSHQSSSAASHCSESRGETPCSLNDDDEEEEEEDSSSPE